MGVSNGRYAGSYMWNQDYDTSPTRGVRALLNEADAHHRMLLRRQDQLLVTEPANLEPVADSQRLAGFRRPLEGWREDVAIHRVPGTDPEAVIAHYQQQAKGAGFTHVREARSPGKARAVWSRPTTTRNDAGTTLLTVRARRDSADVVRVVVWLREPLS